MFETPGTLIKGNENGYLERFRNIYKDNNVIKLPDFDKPLVVYTDKDEPICHIWRGGGYAGLKDGEFNFNEPKFYRRAQRILWIKYILENKEIRDIYKDSRNGNICFVSIELEYTVVIKELKNNFLLITAFHTFDPFRYILNSDKFEKIKK